MKKIPVFWNGKHLKDIYPYATKWQVFKYKVKKFLYNLFAWILILATAFGIFMAGRYLYPTQVYTKQEVIKEVEVKAPILDRIIMCESKNSHFDSNGQVLMRSNTNRTVDLGVAQINTVWFKKATELGYDLTKEQDNRSMALWIYKNVGTDPWNSSKSCWK